MSKTKCRSGGLSSCGDTISDFECKVLKEQIERRHKYRLQFLKERTDPCKHSMEAGYLFDPALQKFISMKTLQLDHFKVNASTIRWALMCVVPMFVYGAALWTERNEREMKIRSGKTRYRERSFKLI